GRQPEGRASDADRTTGSPRLLTKPLQEPARRRLTRRARRRKESPAPSRSPCRSLPCRRLHWKRTAPGRVARAMAKPLWEPACRRLPRRALRCPKESPARQAPTVPGLSQGVASAVHAARKESPARPAPAAQQLAGAGDPLHAL